METNASGRDLERQSLLNVRTLGVAHPKQAGRDNAEAHGEDRMGEEGEK